MILAWNTKTTPILELNLRKFADIVGNEKEGRSVYPGTGGVSLLEGRFSIGMTWWRSLQIWLAIEVFPKESGIPLK